MNTTSSPENHLHTTDAKWFAVYTRYKREKVVVSELRRKGIEVFLPVQKLLRQYGRKKRWVELPLFSCYVFVRITKSEYVPVLEVENVVRFIQFSRNLIAIPDREMELIQRIIGENLPIEAEEGLLQQGDEVEIVIGRLAGVQGKLIEIQGKNKVSIELANLGYTLKLEMPSTYLRRTRLPVKVL